MIKSAPYGKVWPFLSPLYIYLLCRHILCFCFLNVENCYWVQHYYVALGSKEHECFHQRPIDQSQMYSPDMQNCKFSRDDITFQIFGQ